MTIVGSRERCGDSGISTHSVSNRTTRPWSGHWSWLGIDEDRVKVEVEGTGKVCVAERVVVEVMKVSGQVGNNQRRVVRPLNFRGVEEVKFIYSMVPNGGLTSHTRSFW